MARCTLSDRLKCKNKLFFIFLYAPIRSCDKGSFCGRICGLWCYMARNPCKYRASSTCIFASKTACRGFESFCPCQRNKHGNGRACFFLYDRGYRTLGRRSVSWGALVSAAKAEEASRKRVPRSKFAERKRG